MEEKDEDFLNLSELDPGPMKVLVDMLPMIS
jgi:hypothetical protein